MCIYWAGGGSNVGHHVYFISFLRQSSSFNVLTVALNQSTEVLTLLCMAEDFQMKGRTDF